MDSIRRMEGELAKEDNINVREAAGSLGFHLGTVERMCREGRLPAEKMRNNVWLIDKSELEKYVADSHRKTQHMRELGQKLKSARIKLGLSQPEIADILGVSSAAVSRWEHSNRSPRAKHAQQILLWLQQIDQ
jgi:excisionase family DNA binding protein